MAHLDNPAHGPRLRHCARLVDRLVAEHSVRSVTDLGCGDGGLLSLLRSGMPAWGYDVRVASVTNARPGCDVRLADFLTEPVELGDLAVLTEVLEHLDDPDGLLRGLDVSWVVASSPADENIRRHDHTHVWAWDSAGYVDLFTGAGWVVVSHERVGRFQVIAARRG